MKQSITHRWDLTPNEAEALQEELSQQVVTRDCFDTVRTVAGVDVAYDQTSDRLIAAAVVLDASTLAVCDYATAEDRERFPYIPSLFSFRELPPISLALQQLRTWPDLIICDGHGIAHPRRFGLACHLGILFNTPTIGCGKSRLIGEAKYPGNKQGDSSELIHKGETVGRLLRTQPNVRPVYVSPGHKISIETSCQYVIKMTTKYRLPETTRSADSLVKRTLKSKYDNPPPIHIETEI